MKVNTFQVVMATDGRLSFVTFNYPQLMWTTATTGGGNILGLGGTSAMVGYFMNEIRIKHFELIQLTTLTSGLFFRFSVKLKLCLACIL
jgi:Nidogen-like